VVIPVWTGCKSAGPFGIPALTNAANATSAPLLFTHPIHTYIKNMILINCMFLNVFCWSFGFLWKYFP
jgi:hypothetical protein